MKTLYKDLHIHSKDLFKVLNAINKTKYSPRIVGGYVRDSLLSLETNDIDIASPIVPEEIIDLLTKAGIKTIPTGLEFGTITAIINNVKFEITSLRKDIKCDGRRASVEFTEDFALDAMRRDFTINALSYCPFEHIIYDYTNGLENLKNKKVSFIGDPDSRIKEDYLRILRFFRFSSNYASDLDIDGYEACKNNREGIEFLSRERINNEMDKILLSKRASYILRAMKNAKINLFESLDIDEDIISNTDSKNLGVIYALLFVKNDISNLKSSIPGLILSKKMSDMIIDLQSLRNSSDIFYDLSSYWINKKRMDEYLSFAFAINKITKSDFLKLMIKFSSYPPIMPVKAIDLISKGITGKDVGIYLREMTKKWIKSDFNMGKEELLEGLS